ncbi:MAG: TIGR00180 family glycosyltransferase [Alphaproteobacteria bacterium]|nr:TIGR00180 family glycosyltransferase [Alphaproteobacteria bacterium]
MTAPLTLIVFLKDRSDFTKRLIKYLSMVRYPYPVYFADGSIDETNKIYINSLKNENFSFTYKRYPKDLTLSDFYKKSYQTISDIHTPYVMIADNDDFPIHEGQAKAIDFLEKNPDFVGCNGRVLGVSLSPDSGIPYGKNIFFHRYYCQTMDVPVNVDQKSAMDRIDSYLTNFYSIYYSVFRTESLLTTHLFIKDLNFSDLGIYELFFSYMQLSQGKIHSLDATTYIRQKGSSQTAAAQKDWFHRLFYTKWLDDCQKAIGTVAKTIGKNENKNEEECYAILYAHFVDRIRKRHTPNNTHFLKNFHISTLSKRLIISIFPKIFNIFPAVGERLSEAFALSEQRVSSIELLKQGVISENKK